METPKNPLIEGELIDMIKYPLYNDEDTIHFPDCEDQDNQIIPQ